MVRLGMICFPIIIMLNLVNNFSKQDIMVECIQLVTLATMFAIYKALVTDFNTVERLTAKPRVLDSQSRALFNCSELLDSFRVPQSSGPSIPDSEVPVVPSPLGYTACLPSDSYRSRLTFRNAPRPHACVVQLPRAGAALLGLKREPWVTRKGRRPGRACAVAFGALSPLPFPQPLAPPLPSVPLSAALSPTETAGPTLGQVTKETSS